MFPTLLGVITEVDGNKAKVNFMTHGNLQGTVKWPTCQDEASPLTKNQLVVLRNTYVWYINLGYYILGLGEPSFFKYLIYIKSDEEGKSLH